MYLILAVIVTIILIEAITNIVSKSDLFEPLRKFFFESKNRTLKFISSAIECSYCTSVWVSLFCTVMLYLDVINLLPQILALFFIGLVLHRVSNVLHFIIDRIDSNHIDLDKE
jgi:hypothetical protein